MTHSIAAAAQLLIDNLALLEGQPAGSDFLDLACGSGRNGLFLARRKFSVTFADNNKAALEAVAQTLTQDGLPGECWPVDLERDPDSVLDDRTFAGILVFNYLHRPLMAQLKKAVRPGGVIVYETFTTAQREFGRPSNPDFLLHPGELMDMFNDWQVLFSVESTLQNPRRAVAQIIARKPE